MALGYLDDSKLYAIASAIRAKTGDSATMTVDDMPDEIGSISGGGGGGRDPFNDGKSHIIISIPNDDYGDFHLHLKHSVANSLTIDWGDGTVEHIAVGGSSYYDFYHEYADAGSYDIAISGTSGFTTFGGAYGHTVFGTYSSSDANYRQRVLAEYVEIAGGDLISDYAFYSCRSIRQVYFSDGVSTIGTNAFASCVGIEIARIPNGCVVGSNAFNGCWLLGTVGTPEQITVSNGSFGSCYALESLPAVLPSAATNLSFCQNDSSLRSAAVNANGANITIGQNAFNGCSSLEEVTFDAVITSIGNSAFATCARLVEIDSIIEHCTSIGSSAFNNCASLESVTVPAGVTAIQGSTFSYCGSLRKIVVLGDVTSVGASAFANCQKLNSITFKAATPPTLANTNAFTSTNQCNIYVPSASVEAYKTASVWSNLASRIKADPNE